MEMTRSKAVKTVESAMLMVARSRRIERYSALRLMRSLYLTKMNWLLDERQKERITRSDALYYLGLACYVASEIYDDNEAFDALTEIMLRIYRRRRWDKEAVVVTSKGRRSKGVQAQA